MLEYVLEENLLTEAPDDFRAQVVNVTSHTQRDIIDRILRIGAGLTRSDVSSVLEAEKQVVCDIVEEGGAVTTELFNAYPSMPGVYEGATDSFDPSRHQVKLNLHAGVALRDAVGKVRTKKVATGIVHMAILAVTDVKTGSVNNLLTPDRNLKVAGQKLRIAGTDDTVGVYFINQASGERTKVDPSDIVINHPSELILVVPSLYAGTYKIEVTTQFGGNSKQLLKEPHTTLFDKLLTVE
jgi:hypothetical protein